MGIVKSTDPDIRAFVGPVPLASEAPLSHSGNFPVGLFISRSDGLIGLLPDTLYLIDDRIRIPHDTGILRLPAIYNVTSKEAPAIGNHMVRANFTRPFQIGFHSAGEVAANEIQPFFERNDVIDLIEYILEYWEHLDEDERAIIRSQFPTLLNNHRINFGNGPGWPGRGGITR